MAGSRDERLDREPLTTDYRPEARDLDFRICRCYRDVMQRNSTFRCHIGLIPVKIRFHTFIPMISVDEEEIDSAVAKNLL